MRATVRVTVRMAVGGGGRENGMSGYIFEHYFACTCSSSRAPSSLATDTSAVSDSILASSDARSSSACTSAAVCFLSLSHAA